MNRISTLLLTPAIVLAWSIPGAAQLSQIPDDGPVVFSADAVARTAKAVNYKSKGGTSVVDFVGTIDAPSATGEAKVKNTGRAVEISAQFHDLPDPQKFGSEYLTHVLWAVSPEGRVSNLGEVNREKNGKAKLDVTSDLQVFGMVVTAEPYYAVRMPSDVIVLENETTKKTKGRIFFIDAKYELLKRGAYEPWSNPLALDVNLKETPLDVYQARNALAIAEGVGADRYAADSLKRAQASLDMANSSVITKGKEKEVVTLARQAVQFAEDARALAVERIEIERERERQAETEAARLSAEQEAKKRAEEEQARLRAEAGQEEAEKQRLLAERQRLEAELAAEREARERAQAEAAKVAAERDSQQAREAALLAERDKRQAELKAVRESEERARAEAARLAAETASEEARMATREAERQRALAEQEREQAIREKQELRQRILGQLNAILPTRDSERGLVVNLGDVLFDVGKYDLRPVAREKLARVAGTVLAFPSLRLKAEGHTDNTGGEELNQKLSENRAAAAREYLVSQGIPAESIQSEGFGFTRPVADNTTRDGRQANRRVELIISGEAIGSMANSE